jgi:hypothetical protein
MHLSMVHDSIPDELPILRYVNDAKLLAEPAFQLFQFLAWARREMPGTAPIVQKRIFHAFWLPVLDYVTGRRARYAVTLRHPVSSFISWLELSGRLPETRTRESLNRIGHAGDASWQVYCERFAGTSPQAWRGMCLTERFLEFWMAYYLAVADAGIASERLDVVPYGGALADWLVTRHGVPDDVRNRLKGRERAYGPVLRVLAPHTARIAEVMDVVQKRLGLDAAQTSALQLI